MKSEIIKLKNLLQENRSDIAEILDAILKGEAWGEEQIEARYIQAEILNLKVQYDTLTTELCFLIPTENEWRTASHHEYIRDNAPVCERCEAVLSYEENRHGENVCFPCLKH